jgi:hypothetical protein
MQPCTVRWGTTGTPHRPAESLAVCSCPFPHIHTRMHRVLVLMGMMRGPLPSSTSSLVGEVVQH